jgi:hypothetical protein
MFKVSVTCVHSTIHTLLYKLHPIVRREIQWHDAGTWRALAGTYEDFPSAVAMIDGSPVWTNVPTDKEDLLIT